MNGLNLTYQELLANCFSYNEYYNMIDAAYSNKVDIEKEFFFITLGEIRNELDFKDYDDVKIYFEYVNRPITTRSIYFDNNAVISFINYIKNNYQNILPKHGRTYDTIDLVYEMKVLHGIENWIIDKIKLNNSDILYNIMASQRIRDIACEVKTKIYDSNRVEVYLPFLYLDKYDKPFHFKAHYTIDQYNYLTKDLPSLKEDRLKSTYISLSFAEEAQIV